MAKKKEKFEVNDLARIVQADGELGPTLWIVEWIGERGYCVIREAGKALAGGQDYDLSLLRKVQRS